MKTVYNKYNALTEDGLEIHHEFGVAISSLFKKYIALGFNPRELGAIAISEASVIASENILRNAMEMRKAEKAQKAS